MQPDSGILVRRAFLFGAPLLYLVLGVLHPFEDPDVGDAATLFVWLHVAQLFLIGGLAYSIWLLVNGVEGTAATVARALILPYVIAYTTFDAIVGIAMGQVVQRANTLPAGEQAVVGRLVESLRGPELSGYVLYFGASLLWLSAVVAVMVALRDRVRWQPLVLLVLGATIFAIAHPKPTGPIGMALFLAGVVWLELRPQKAEVQEAVPAA